MLRSLAVREVHFLRELEEGYPYEVVGVDRITVGCHQWCVVHLLKDFSITKVVIEKSVFTEPEELLVFLGVIKCVLVYSDLNTVERSTYRILCYDTMVGQLYEK